MPARRPACGSSRRMGPCVAARAAAGAPVAARIDALLPQTQCTRCGYPGCRPYAAGHRRGEAEINQCPPGGSATIRALAELARPRIPSVESGERRRVTAARRLDRRGALHRLRALPAALPGGCDRGRGQVLAYRARRSLHGVRAVPGALPGRLHRNAAGRRACCRLRSTAGATRRTLRGSRHVPRSAGKSSRR